MPGMRPRVTSAGDGREIAPAVTLIIAEKEPGDSTAMFRHIVKKTPDPEKRYKEALRVLASAYFQFPGNFSDVLLGIFSLDSSLATGLAEAGECVLEFEQFSQRYRIPCAIESRRPGDEAYQAAYWHNHMFNPAMPGAVRVIAFTPDWRQATAYPPV
jgi:hypothetical protein